MSRVDTVLIVGVGLIGGSLAGAWRQAGFAARVLGMDADEEAAAIAVERGLVDAMVSRPPDRVDLIAVCTSSDQIAEQVAALAPHAGVIVDVGSVKAPILSMLEKHYGGVPENFVPCHPISGSELSGPQAARADLFEDAVVVVTDDRPAQGTEVDDNVELAEAAWRAAGATVLHLSPRRHDEMLAVTSHLPHLLAFTFMQQIDASLLPFTGGGFRDFTRIAAANPELWWRILSMNKSEVLAAAEAFSAHLQQFTAALQADDAETGTRVLREAAALRQQL